MNILENWPRVSTSMFVAAETKRYGMIGKSVFAFRLYRSHSLYYLCKLMVSAIVCDELRDECREPLRAEGCSSSWSELGFDTDRVSRGRSRGGTGLRFAQNDGPAAATSCSAVAPPIRGVRVAAGVVVSTTISSSFPPTGATRLPSYCVAVLGARCMGSGKEL